MLHEKKNRLSLSIAEDLCLGCGQCLERCRRKVIGIRYRGEIGYAVVKNPESCTGCGRCAKVCPTRAIDRISIF